MSGPAWRIACTHFAALAASLMALCWHGLVLAESVAAEPLLPEPSRSQLAAPPDAGLLMRSRQEILQEKVDAPTGVLLAGEPHVLVVDLPDLQWQGAVFGRIVAFLERAGAPRTRILSAAEFRHWLDSSSQRSELLTLGNNLEALNLARFYNTASLQGEPLTQHERWLLDELLRFGVLQKGRRGFVPSEPPSIVLTLPGVSTVEGCAACAITPHSRQLIFEHEYGHAVYFGDVFLQQYTEWFWFNRISLALRSRVQRFLAARGYDSNQLPLVLNEFYAYLIHTEDALLFKPSDWGLSEAELKSIRTDFNARLKSWQSNAGFWMDRPVGLSPANAGHFSIRISGIWD